MGRVGGPVQAGGRDAAVEGEPQRDVAQVLRDVLVDGAVREAGQRGDARADDDLGLGAGGAPAHEREDLRGDGSARAGSAARRCGGPIARAHPRTPTRIPRNRAGTAGCPVWPICWGWPLPQLGVPQTVHSSGPPSMSIEPQKRGLIAV